jgi:hydrogenase maturation protease
VHFLFDACFAGQVRITGHPGMKARIAVLGLGNPLMTDEGVGAVFIQRLQAHALRYPQVEFIDAGTGGMKLIHLLEGREKVIFIDCAFMQTAPGTLRRFALNEVLSVKELPDLSLHEGDLLQILRMARQLGACPLEVIIFGIEPERMEPGQTLTSTLVQRLDDYDREILAELEDRTI